MNVPEALEGLPHVSSTTMTRQTILKGAAAVAGAMALSRVHVGIDRAEAMTFASPLPKDIKASFSIFGDDYNPTASMVKSADNPTPTHNLQVVINEYQAMYPGVHITIITPHYANDDRRTWEVTQLAGDVAYEILQTPAAAIVPDMGKGWWTILDPYLAQPNPYVPTGHPGHVHWIDEFYPALADAQRAPDGHLYALPYDMDGSLWYYNKTAFQKVGTAAPKTYADLLSAAAKLQKAGYAAIGSRTTTAPWYGFGEQVMRRYEKIIPHTGGGGSFTTKDIALAILHGLWGANTPEYRDFLLLLKQQIPYWKRDWPLYLQTIDPTVEGRFQQGSLAILNHGFEFVSLLNANTTLQFEWDAVTTITVGHGTGPGQSIYSTGTPPAVTAGADVMYGVTKTAREKGTLPIVIDFLRYMSAPKQAGRIINELGAKLPIEIEAPVNKALQGVVQSLSHGARVAPSFFGQYSFSPEAYQAINSLTAAYLLGQASLDTTLAALQKELLKQSKDAAAKFGWKY